MADTALAEGLPAGWSPEERTVALAAPEGDLSMASDVRIDCPDRCTALNQCGFPGSVDTE